MEHKIIESDTPGDALRLGQSRDVKIRADW